MVLYELMGTNHCKLKVDTLFIFIIRAVTNVVVLFGCFDFASFNMTVVKVLMKKYPFMM